MQAMEARAVRKRQSLYSQRELAELLGVAECTIRRLEKRPFTPLLEAYLKAIGYRVSIYPKR